MACAGSALAKQSKMLDSRNFYALFCQNRYDKARNCELRVEAARKSVLIVRQGLQIALETIQLTLYLNEVGQRGSS